MIIKALVLNEFVRADYFVGDDLDYSNSKTGSKFNQVFNKYGLVEGKDYDYNYFVRDIPKAAKVYNNRIVSYKSPSSEQIKKAKSEIEERIKDYDIILVTGKYGLSYFYPEYIVNGKKKILPKMTKLLSHDKIVNINGKDHLILPVFSQELVDMDNEKAYPRNLVIRKLALYLKGYWNIKTSRVGNYKIADTVDKVKAVFNSAKNHVTAWDTEDNGFDAHRKNSRVLCMTISFKPGTGYYIPLAHRQSPFSKEELIEVKKCIKEFLEGPNIKVAHNSRFDIDWMIYRGIAGHVHNIRDTKIGYWLLVDQRVSESLRLTDLAWQVTPIGGYDDPLESYKDWFTSTLASLCSQMLKKKYRETHPNLKGFESGNELLNEEDKDFLMANIIPEKFVDDNPLLKLLSKASRDSHIKLNKKIFNEKYMDNDVLEDAINSVVNLANKWRVDTKIKDHFNYDIFPLKVMLNYSVGDADACLQIYQWEEKVVNKSTDKIKFLFEKFYPEFVYTLSRIQSNGAHLNLDYTKELKNAYADESDRIYNELLKFPDIKQLVDIKQELYLKGLAEKAKPTKERDKEVYKYYNRYKDEEDRNFKPNADKKTLLLDVMGVNIPDDDKFKTNKGEISVGAETISYLLDNLSKDSDAYKIVDLLDKYTQSYKIKTTYTDTMLDIASDVDDSVHGTFNETGTSTSRLSSSHPNMQNIPSPHSNNIHEFGNRYPIKRQYNSRFKNGIIFNCDYSNLELRILGLISGDEGMYHTFISGKDIHKATASDAFKVPLDEVTKSQRQAAKRVSFGIVYGISKYGLSVQLGVTPDEAQDFIDKYLDSKPAVEKLINDVHDFVKRNGFVELLSGFRRQLPGIFSADKASISSALRESVNTLIQGSGAYLTNSSLVYIQNYLEKTGKDSKLALTVHDSIMGDVPYDEITDVLPQVLNIMTNLPYSWLQVEHDGETVRYPIDAEMTIGYNYSDQVDFDLEDFNTFLSPNGYIDYYMQLDGIEARHDSGDISDEEYTIEIEKAKNSKEKYRSIPLQN
ncbi:hypothetical protein [Levilactobacillus phage ENFP1]|nr:hypothetical protein [Levilactobacillus phage ENFP1]